MKGGTAQNEGKCPQEGPTRWTLMPLEVSMWFMARS